MTVISVPVTPHLPQTMILHERGWKHYHAVSPGGYLSIKSFYAGEAHYAVGNSRYRVNAQVYLILNHGQPYAIDIDTTEDVESFCIFFSPGFVEAIRYSLTTSSDELLSDPAKASEDPSLFFEKTYLHDTLLSPSIEHLRRVVVAGSAERERGWFVEHLTTIASHLLQVHHNVYKEVEALPAVRAATREELYRRLHIARDYMDALFHTPIQLDDIARSAYLSPNHLLRTFKQAFGLTPHQYILNKRLKEAQRLLRETELPVTEICLAVGFESPGTFSWTFHQRLGVSPSQFRRQNG